MMTTDIDHYNRSFEEYVETFEEEADNRLKLIRQQCVRNFINRLSQRNKEWEETFQELLTKSQEEDLACIKNKPSLPIVPVISTQLNFTLAPQDCSPSQTLSASIPDATHSKLDSTNEISSTNNEKVVGEKQRDPTEGDVLIISVDQEKEISKKSDQTDFCDPLFSNFNSVKEFVRIQELLEETRKSLTEFSTSLQPELKTYRNKLCQFVKQHVNSITVDSQQLDTKTKLFLSLFTGKQVEFQDSIIDVNKHPHARLFSIDFAAQTFVTGGTKIPEIAKSIAAVITGIVSENFSIFRDLVIGHLQERCPYLIPMYPKLEEFDKKADVLNPPINYKIACGYCIDPKKQTLESEEKYLARMRSMTLMYACLLAQDETSHAWTWLTSFLSLKPQPIISATILQAFLQEASKKMSSVYGIQYKKIVTFIREDYVKMIDQVTSKTTDRQSFVKLKNLLSNESNLVAAPSISSIFGVIKQ